MIKSLTITNPDRTPCEWWPEVAAYRDRDHFDFNPHGLTVLWGPNGSGKSTMIKVLARLTHCEQAGVPTVTEASVRDFTRGFGKDRVDVDGATICTDGRPVFYVDPSNTPGLSHGGAAFDFDFLAEGIQSVRLRNLSSGQQTTARMSRVLKKAASVTEVEWRVNRGFVNDIWQHKIDVATRGLVRNTDENGPPTILMDEPTRSLELVQQAMAWDTIAAQKRFQIVVATHSVFALGIPEATYIDVVPGYLDRCRAVLKRRRW